MSRSQLELAPRSIRPPSSPTISIRNIQKLIRDVSPTESIFITWIYDLLCSGYYRSKKLENPTNWHTSTYFIVFASGVDVNRNTKRVLEDHSYEQGCCRMHLSGFEGVFVLLSPLATAPKTPSNITTCSCHSSHFRSPKKSLLVIAFTVALATLAFLPIDVMNTTSDREGSPALNPIDDRLLEFTMRIFNTLPNTILPYRASSPFSSDSDYARSDTSTYESDSSVSTPRSIDVPLSFDAIDDCMNLKSIFLSNKDEAGILGYDPDDATPTSEFFLLKEREELHRQELNRNGWTDLDRLNPRAPEFVPLHPASPSVAIIIPSAPATATTLQSGTPSNPAWYISFIAGSKSRSTDGQLHNSIDIIEAGTWTMEEMADLAQHFCWKGAEGNHPYLAFFARILYIKFDELRGEEIAKSFLWHLRECVVGTFKVCWDSSSDEGKQANNNSIPSHVEASTYLCAFIGDLFSEGLLSPYHTHICLRLLLRPLSSIEHIDAIHSLLVHAMRTETIQLWTDIPVDPTTSTQTLCDDSSQKPDIAKFSIEDFFFKGLMPQALKLKADTSASTKTARLGIEEPTFKIAALVDAWLKRGQRAITEEC